MACGGGAAAGPGRGASSPLRRHREALTARGSSSGQSPGRGRRFRPACPARRPLAAGRVRRGDFHALAWIFKRKTNHRKLARPGASSGPSRRWTSRLTRSSPEAQYCDRDFIWRQAPADVTELKRRHSDPATVVPSKRTWDTDTQGGGHVRTQAGTGLMQPQAKDPLAPPEATTRQEGRSPRASRGSEGRLTPWR